VIPGPLRSPPHSLLAALCAGIATANALRLPGAAVFAATGCVGLAVIAPPAHRLLAIACALAVAGWWLGSVRLAHLDRSVLLARVGTAERALVDVTAPPRRGRFDSKVTVRVRRFGGSAVDERAQLELPLGRSPPLGAILDVRAEVKLPRGPRHGFDERTWLRRHGIHVVLAGDEWRVVGSRGGIARFGDLLRRSIGRAVGAGVRGERRGVLLGVVLGDEEGLSRGLRERFRASGLYHLLRQFQASYVWSRLWPAEAKTRPRAAQFRRRARRLELSEQTDTG
jgi:predicted membrane metal-binding protein